MVREPWFASWNGENQIVPSFSPGSFRYICESQAVSYRNRRAELRKGGKGGKGFSYKGAPCVASCGCGVGPRGRWWGCLRTGPKV